MNRISLDPVASGLAWFNRLPVPAAEDLLRDCLDEPTWALAVANQRPFADVEALHRGVSAAVARLTDPQLRQILAGRSRLGGTIPPENRHSPGEQLHLRRDVGLLTAAQQAYEHRFGFIFMIRAAGRSIDEISAELHRRMHNTLDIELDEVRREFTATTVLRLESVLDETAGRGRPCIALINPNSSAATTAMLEAVAVDHLRDRVADFDLRSWQPDSGPRIITNAHDLESAVPEVVRGAMAMTRTIDHVAGMIICAIGDPGVDQLRDHNGFPVVGIGSASIREASADGRRFSIVTTTPALAPSLARLARRHGSTGTFAGVALTDSAASADPGPLRGEDADLLTADLANAVHRAVTEYGAEAVIIGGGPLAASARRLTAPAGAIIVEPLVAALDEIIGAVNQAH